MISNKIIPKLKKAISKYGVDVEAFKYQLNEFKEPNDATIDICRFKGLFSENNQSINKTSLDYGKYKKEKSYKLITLIDEDTMLLIDGDILSINEEEFILVNIDNANMLDAYFDITIVKRC